MSVAQTCAECGNIFELSPSHVGKRKYCSNQCRAKASKTIITCAYCGKPFEVYKTELPRKRFCSKHCQNENQRSPTEFVCETCGITFTKVFSRVKGKHIYCSQKCAHTGRQRRKIKPCYICGTPVIRPQSLMNERVTCGEQCYREFKRIMATGENSPVKNSVPKTCVICGKKFEVPASKSYKGLCCSAECRCKYVSLLFKRRRYDKWAKGITKQLYRGPNWEEQRQKALERDGHKCRKCSSTECVCVHHKKPFRNFHGDYVKANTLGNLVTLCRSCHSKQKVHRDKSKDPRYTLMPLFDGNTVATALNNIVQRRNA